MNRVGITTYSPYLDEFKTDDHNQFTVPYGDPGVSNATGTLSGWAKSAINCAPMAGVTVSNANGGAITDVNGKFSFASPARKSSTITPIKTGWVSNAQTATSTINAVAEPS